MNIDNFVGCETIGKTKNTNGIYIYVEKMNLYTDYTTVDIKIKNSTANKICLDTKENIDKTYLYDENNVTYTAFVHELADEELKIPSRRRKDIKNKI